MEENVNKQNYLCIEFHDKNGNIDPNLSRCPANPEMLMAALQFLTPGSDFVVSITDAPIDFFDIVFRPFYGRLC